MKEYDLVLELMDSGRVTIPSQIRERHELDRGDLVDVTVKVEEDEDGT